MKLTIQIERRSLSHVLGVMVELLQLEESKNPRTIVCFSRIYTLLELMRDIKKKADQSGKPTNKVKTSIDLLEFLTLYQIFETHYEALPELGSASVFREDYLNEVVKAFYNTNHKNILDNFNHFFS